MFSHPISVARVLSDRFTLIIDGLCQALAARAPSQPMAGPLLVLLWGRLRRLAARFANLAEQADGAMPVRRRAMRAARPVRTDRRWPAGFAWLVRLVPEAAAYGSQLRQLLAEPAMAELMAALPQARRTFGPLATMLAVPTAAKPGPQARAAKPLVVVAPVSTPAQMPIAVTRIVGVLAGAPGWARTAWPGHDFAGREPPSRGLPALERSG